MKNFLARLKNLIFFKKKCCSIKIFCIFAAQLKTKKNMKAIEILKLIESYRIPSEYYRIISKWDKFDIIDVCENNNVDFETCVFRSYFLSERKNIQMLANAENFLMFFDDEITSAFPQEEVFLQGEQKTTKRVVYFIVIE